MCIGLLVLVGIGHLYFLEKVYGEEIQASAPFYSAPEFTQPLSSYTEPGLLSNFHKHLEGIENCSKCHPTTENPGSAKCLECHQEIKERWDKQAGYHGKYLRGNCIECHKEHKGVDASITEFNKQFFNHNLALFPLEGRHRSVECEACHLMRSGETGVLTFRYLGIPQECYKCHTTPHGAGVDINCTRCHTQVAWTGRQVLFDHNRDAAFKLRGAHIDLDCAQCHPDKKFTPLSGECGACHEDPHQGLWGANCARCHNEQRWSDARFLFNHDTQTSFPLTGKHQELKCEQCHFSPTKPPPQKCVECHRDVHNAKFGNDCSACHNTFDWSTMALEKFNHNTNTAFPLSGKHVGLDCASCHPEGDIERIKGTTCVECHPDVYHGGELGEKCDRCHGTQQWKIEPLEFNHEKIAEFNLGKLHGDLACADCHKKKGTFGGITGTCESCHKDIADYMAGLGVIDTMTTIAASVHYEIGCAKCHSPEDLPGVIAPISRRCASCHTESYTDLAKFWVNDLDARANALEDQIDAARLYLEQLSPEERKKFSPRTITIETMEERIGTVLKIIKRIRGLGFHNIHLALREYETAENLLDEFRVFLHREIPEIDASPDK